jgi:predicted unusual protein kinase regulating ubiquinone biosynthesis (AarF/ABC1/UbiB family)
MPRLPTSRIARTARFGRMAAGAAIKRDDPVAAADQIVDQLGRMKGAAMKIGQVLSTIDFDLVPEGEREAFKERLAALRDQAPSVPFKQMERLITRELDGPVAQVFAEFDPEPIAAASIGQVYRARTHEGQDVAVKVQYPGVAEAVDTDLRNMNLLFPLVKRLAPGLDVKAIGGELRERIAEELDYEIEAQNQRRVARVYRGHPHVKVPEV